MCVDTHSQQSPRLTPCVAAAGSDLKGICLTHEVLAGGGGGLWMCVLWELCIGRGECLCCLGRRRRQTVKHMSLPGRGHLANLAAVEAAMQHSIVWVVHSPKTPKPAALQLARGKAAIWRGRRPREVCVCVCANTPCKAEGTLRAAPPHSAFQCLTFHVVYFRILLWIWSRLDVIWTKFCFIIVELLW